MKSSTKHQEQSDSHPRQVDTPSNEPITPWYGWFPYSYLPMDYSRIYMQSYYIQYHPMYPNYVSPQRPVVSSNDLVKQDIDCSKADEKGSKRDSKYLQPKWCPSGLSHTQKKVASYAQEGDNGATSRGRAKDINNHEEGMAAETSCFNINLSKIWPIIVYHP